MRSQRLFLAAAATALTAFFAAATASKNMKPVVSSDTDTGHVLKDRWAEYEKARKADRPLKEADILLDIRSEAMRRHLPADFYDAGSAYIASVQRRNWKLRDSVRTEFAALVRQFGEPIVTYTWMGDFGGASSDERRAFVAEAEPAFSAARHPEFYRTLGGYLGGALKDFVANDFEYVLWDLLAWRRLSWTEPEKDEIFAALRSEIGNRYPAEPCLRYHMARNLTEEQGRGSALSALAADPSARAVAFYARQDLLRMRFDSLSRKAGASSEAYKALRTECRRFLADKAALKGTEARIAEGCDAIEPLVRTLDRADLILALSGDSVTVGFRNLSGAQLTLAGKKIQVSNPSRSYYALDSVKVPLPVLSDGEYTFEAVSGDVSARLRYRRFTLSLAQRRTAEGIGVYVADYDTGRPLETATIRLRKGNATLVSETLALNGFTLLSGRFADTMKSNAGYVLQAAYTGADGRERLSPELSFSPSVPEEAAVREEETVRACFYTDRGAYHPGDTLSFKAVLFNGDLTETVSVLPEMPVEVVLRNAQGDELERKIQTTNEFGSVAERFVLPSGQRGGLFSLQLFTGGRPVGWRSFRVDEFILPNFTLSFDPVEALYRPGDTVRVAGRVAAYSGHSLSGARASARVLWYGELISEETLPLAEDGFTVSFRAKDTGFYSVEVRVTDATGETQEAAASVFVTSSIRIMTEIGPSSDGECVLTGDRTQPSYRRDRAVVAGDSLHVVPTVQNARGDKVPLPLDYVLSDEGGRTVFSGRADSGEPLDFDLSACPSGLYVFKVTAQADGIEKAAEEETRLLLVRSGDTTLDAPVSRLFVSGPSDLQPGEKIRVQAGTADGGQWAVATLLGRNRDILSTRMLHWEGERGKAGSLQTLEWDYPDTYPDAVRLQIFYFKHGEAVTFEREYRRVRSQLDLPLAFSSFTDRTLPGTEYTFTLKTLPGVEAVAAVYDKSLDAFGSNMWPTVSLRPLSAAYVPLRSVCGAVGGGLPYGDLRLMRSAKMSATSAGAMLADTAVEMDVQVEESVTLNAAPAARAALYDEESAETMPVVRERFADVLAFQPFLRSDENGGLSFRFSTSDRLSTYYVSVFAHDKAMRNALVREEIVVTVPVKVSVAEPAYLYAGDRYRIAVSVGSRAGMDLEGGKVRLQLYDTADWKPARPVRTLERDIPLLADGATETADFEIDVDEIMAGQAGVLGILVSYGCGSVSDGLFLPVPVRPSVQRLTEAHSAVLSAGTDREAVLERLRAAFVNAPGSEAVFREVSLLDKVREALPSKAEPAAGDVLSLSEAWYVRLVAETMGGSFDSASGSAEGSPETPMERLTARILACRNDDGGFAWFEGMKSSPVITAALLERFAKIRSLGLPADAALEAAVPAAVRFLDRNQFDAEWPSWCGGLSADRYLYVRSFYPSVPFDVQPSGSATVFNKRMKEFRKYVTEYLTPKSERGLSGQILAKARRLRTLQNLLTEAAGPALARAWGLPAAATGRIQKSLGADVVSLLEYAVGHPDGGEYYPNAVMPVRGLLDGEAYAHSMLCDLFAGLAAEAGSGKTAVSGETAARLAAVADGIRLWLMLQKETQRWDEDPAFVDAVHSVLQGSEAVLATRILVMEETFDKPFPEIRAAGNGFTVVRTFFRAVGVEEKYDDRTTEENRTLLEWEEIRPGTILRVGDRIAAEYRIRSDENRSFVKVSAPREASLVPVDPLSGPYGGGIRPLRISGSLLFRPQGYRDVRADRTDYYFDTFPEETTTVREEFFVVRAGTFSAPVLSVESLYAPQYRANDGWPGKLESAF